MVGRFPKLPVAEEARTACAYVKCTPGTLNRTSPRTGEGKETVLVVRR